MVYYWCKYAEKVRVFPAMTKPQHSQALAENIFCKIFDKQITPEENALYGITFY